ncbi:MAG: lyase family protein [Actinomycetota bacterium]|nr:lyase family protein [Actinomycetota bacterium]
MSVIFDPIFGQLAVGSATNDRALLDALCETETALARACARSGLIELATALEIGGACEEVRRMDPVELGRRSVAGGNPVIPLVAELRTRLEARAAGDAAQAVHLGATSQDVLDTALMLICSRALGVVLGDLGDCAELIAALAGEHRDTPMAGRTLLQQAVPTTFGALAAVWGSGLDRSRARLDAVRAALPVQLGGAAGTLAGLHPHGLQVQAALGHELDLAVPEGVWHTDRTVLTELAGTLGTVAATIAKVASDIVLLAQSELAELAEAAPGGSSAMAHKQNPIAAVTARAAAMQVPGLVATLLSAASPDLQRGAGSWHAEWTPLLTLLRTVGGASSRLRTSLSGLAVDTAAMAGNLGALEGTVDITDLGHAADLVDRYLDRRRS